MTDRENPWIEGIKTVALSGILALGIRSLVAEARYIPSESMVPTLQINDRLIIDKLSYHFTDPQRGDVVVFMPPDKAGLCLNPQSEKPVAPKEAFIKRIIGLPGETVQVKGEKVYINDKPLQEKYINELTDYDYGPVTVPENSFLVLGDNRNNSCDGHSWGYVPRQNIIGKAIVRFWPLNRLGALDKSPVYPATAESQK